MHARYKYGFGHTRACAHSRPVSSPNSGITRPLGAISFPGASERPAVRPSPPLRPLLSELPGVHHAEAARARARNGGREAGQGRGHWEQRPLRPPGQARRPPPRAGARRGARSRVPPGARPDTKGWRESAERGCCLRSGWRPEAAWTGLRGWSGAGRNRALGRGRGVEVGGWRGALSPPLALPHRCSCLAGPGGAGRGAGAAQGPPRAGRTPPFSLARSNGGAGRFSRVLSFVCALRQQGDAAL